MFGNKKDLEAELAQQGGVVASARVTDSRVTRGDDNTGSTGRASGGTIHAKFSLRVNPDGQEAFDVTFKQAFVGAFPIKGFFCQVIYDPSDHSRIAIQRDSITPRPPVHTQADAGSPAVLSGAPASGDVADQLTKFADLHDRGVLTDAEFATQKAKLLGES
jgi:Short C-terminal domain